MQMCRRDAQKMQEKYLMRYVRIMAYDIWSKNDGAGGAWFKRDLWIYCFELQAPENAAGQVRRLEEQIISLETMPERYRRYETEPWKSRGLRILPVDNYVVLYIPDEDRKTVEILRVMYGGRNIDKQLNLYTKQ